MNGQEQKRLLNVKFLLGCSHFKWSNLLTPVKHFFSCVIVYDSLHGTKEEDFSHFLKVSCYFCSQFCVSSNALSCMFYHSRTLFHIQGTFLKSLSLNGKRRIPNPGVGRRGLQNAQKGQIYLLTMWIHPDGAVLQK